MQISNTLFRRLRAFYCILLLVFFSFLSCTPTCIQEDSDMLVYYRPVLLKDSIVWDKHNHSAFTSLVNYKNYLLAFRESEAHRPLNIDEYGTITVLRITDKGLNDKVELSDSNMDLRDPFFLEMNGSLLLFSGYNQIKNGVYQHSGTVYSSLSEDGWSDFKPIRHDVNHVIWLWKIRKYKDSLYGVGYLEEEQPILMKSTNGIDWTTVTTFNLRGILSEADICFLEDTMYVALRQDSPIGASSYWGKASYPFSDFKWKSMDISIASPELLIHSDSKQIFLAGREYVKENSSIRAFVSLFEISTDGMASRLYSLDKSMSWDKGYPSMLMFEDKLLMSYYSGREKETQVHLVLFRFEGIKTL